MNRQFIIFFYNDTATTEIYTLSLHDALPISAFLVDGDLHVVHLVVIEGDRLPERAVALHQRGDGLVQLLLDEAAHAEHLAAHALEVLVEATRDVVTEVGGFHQLASFGFARVPARGNTGNDSGTPRRESKPLRWSGGEAAPRSSRSVE